MSLPAKALCASLVFLCLGACTGPAAGIGTEKRDLSGVWQINFSDDPRFARFDLDDSNWTSIQVPGTWAGLREHTGIAWYRTTLEMKQASPVEGRGVYLGQIEDADEVFFNGVMIGRTGSMTDSALHSYTLPRVYYLPSHVIRSGRNVLAVRVRGFRARTSGIISGPLLLGDWHELHRYTAIVQIERLAFAVVFAAVGFYFLLLFARVPTLRFHLHFGIVATLLGGYSALQTVPAVESLGFLTAKRWEYVALLLTPIPFLGFFVAFLRMPSFWARSGFYMFCAVAAAFPILTEDIGLWADVLGYWYYGVCLVMAWILFSLAVRSWRGDSEARIILIGFVLVCVTVVHDMIRDRGFIVSVPLLRYGFACFIGSIAVALVGSFVRLQRESDETARRLLELDTLKERVLANVTEMIRTPVDQILAAAGHLNGNAEQNRESYRILREEGAALRLALDHMMVLSKIQSGVERSELRVMDNSELREAVPAWTWPVDVKVCATPLLLETIAQLMEERGAEAPPNIVRLPGAKISLTWALSGDGTPSSLLSETLLHAAVRELAGVGPVKSGAQCFVELPNMEQARVGSS